MLPTPHRLLAALLLLQPAAAAAAGAPELLSLQPAVHHASLAKQQAILGGMSRLQMIAARQGGAALPAVSGSSQPVEGGRPDLRAAEGGGDRPDVFGSSALDVNATPLDRQWRRVRPSLAGEAAAPADFVRRFPPDDRKAQVEAVNQWINRNIAFGDDSRIHGTADKWATLAETLERGAGDCEDFAIAKMQLLRSLGFPAGDLYLTVVRDLVRSADHALLLVRLDDRLLVLDNNTDRILESQDVGDYRPIVSFAAGGSWVHGYKREMQHADSAASAAVRGTR